MKEITERLERGVKELFTSDMYTEYLNTMSKFYNYSFNNTVLIAMQKPEATLVAGYQAWQKKFGRHVKKGQRGIRIIAPTPVKLREEVEKYDPDTHELLLRPDGQPETEEVVSIIPRFRVTTVFDVSQTDGKPLPEITAKELLGSVENFEIFMKALEMISPVPSRFAPIDGEAKGFYNSETKEIVIREDMSESQTMKTAVHEVTHAMLHDRDLMEEQGEKKNRLTREVEAESVAYTVCQYFGLDTSDYSFPYIASWSSDMDMKELRSSMDLIRKTAASFIDNMVENIQKLQREQPEKRQLQETDLILNISRWSANEFSYMIVENLERKELLEQLRAYQERYSQSREMALDTFLEGQGVRLIPWYDSKEPETERAISFCDVEYDYENGIRDTEKLPSLERSAMMIERAEYRKKVLSDEDRALIMNYAMKFDDMEDARDLMQELREAVSASNTAEAEEIRERARAEIAKLPDPTTSIMYMHEYGCYDDSMLPLTMGRAVELHHAGLHIYSLREDGSSVLMDTELDIVEDGGLFGVDARSWENYRVRESAYQKVTVTEETSRLVVEGCPGTWRVAEKKEVEGEAFFLMEQNGKTAFGQIIVDSRGHLVADQLKFGFSGAVEKIAAAVRGKGKQISVYPHTFAHASGYEENLQYALSRSENLACKNAIEQAIRENFDGMSLKQDAVRQVIDVFGAERVAYVLAFTIHDNERDGRFSGENKKWAEGFCFEEDKDPYGAERKQAFLLDSHPAVLDGFTTLVRKELPEPEAGKVTEQEKVFSETEVPEEVQKEPVLNEIEPQGTISFYVAECSEFPVMGEYHENLTLQEAFQIYEKIPSERMNGGKGIGFCLEDGSPYGDKFDLMVCGRMQTDIINLMDEYRENPLVQKAIRDMEVLLQKEKPREAEQPAKGKAPEPEKEAKTAPQTDRGINRKESVLSALRERQSRMREQSKPEQKASAHRKGDQEL